eukprot:TRINITY_DN66053_c0_g1_i1.p1 TRINITY_DN66053_c0_g1~~TRINITY_DN66053_c0_g1_i1.p1  ORF type:complete len:216 (-),score=46.88 TRINITY_DN66053_c0_g1_i1:130-777(-)
MSLLHPTVFCSLASVFFFFLMIRRPPRSTQGVSSAASDVYKRQVSTQSTWGADKTSKGWIKLWQKRMSKLMKKIRNGEAVVVTAEEVIDIIREKGIKKAAEYVDVVTTATFGPMCSSGAFLNFGHASPPIRMQKTYLNQVESYSGIAAVDTYIGATEWSKDKGYEYGGAHVICDLIDGKSITLEATANASDCYPCLLYTSPSPRDLSTSRMPSSA